MAGHKLRQWRNAHMPALSVQAAAAQFGLAHMSLYRLEAGMTPAGRKVMDALTGAGVCEPGDFFVPAPSPGNAEPQRRSA